MIWQLTKVIVFLLLSTSAAAQFVPERAAIKRMEKNKWEKAGAQLHKSLRKDSVNTLTQYLLSVYFFKAGNPSRNVDSAYRYVMASLKDFTRASSREKERLKRFPLDSARLVSLREAIDSAAFEEARTLNTEQGYIRFMEAYPYAAQQAQAAELRDEVAYLQAASINTYESFLLFLNKYPNATRAAEARAHYHRLLFEAKTRDKRLVNFETFLKEYPETPFRREVEQNIFELFTLSGEPERYLSFIQQYPDSYPVKQARNILFHILQEREDAQWPGLFLTDSLQNIRKLQEHYLVPFLHAGKFGFMDKNGSVIIPASLGDLSEEYSCGNMLEDIIVLPDRILARNGAIVYSGKVEEVDDLGTGFLKLKGDECFSLVHKSGEILYPCVKDAKVLGQRFIAILADGGWTLHALTGRRILPNAWEEIIIHHTVLGFRRSGKWQMVTLHQLLEIADHQRPTIRDEFDDVKPLPNGLLLVKDDGYQGILDQHLSDVVPYNKQVLTPTFFGYVGLSESGYTLYNKSGTPASYFEKVETHEPWVVVNKNGSSFLFDPVNQVLRSPAYDSLRFEGPFAVGISSDTLTIYFADSLTANFAQPARARFVPGKDSTSFLAVATTETVTGRRGRKTTETMQTVFNYKGKNLFTGSFDNVQYAGQDLFIVHKKEKKGLVDASGNTVLPVEYDAIGSVGSNVVSLLRSMKFGLYNVTLQKLIKPNYDKNLVPYADRYIAAYGEGKYGFINWDGEPAKESGFDEIRYWNDTTALVRKQNLWTLLNLDRWTPVQSDISEVKMISDTPDEKLAIIRQGEMYGVISNRKGIVIPVSFTDLVNIGSAEEPMYFTEKHVSEASVFVVIYYDRGGRFIRREIYENTEDYEKIYCPDN